MKRSKNEYLISSPKVERPSGAERAERRTRSRTTSLIWGITGLICFGVGAIGAVIPLIPTTPFILLAAFCFARSSRKLNAWFRSTKLYKTVIEGLVTRRAMTLSAKLKLLAPICTLLIIAIALMHNVPVGQIVVGIVLVAHVIYFGFVVKTERPDEEVSEANPRRQEIVSID